MVRVVAKYIAKDGTEFSTRKGAEEYESKYNSPESFFENSIVDIIVECECGYENSMLEMWRTGDGTECGSCDIIINPNSFVEKFIEDNAFEANRFLETLEQ